MSADLKGHTIIVTGACGSIGLLLSEYLLQAGGMVIGIGRPSSKGQFQLLRDKYPLARFFAGDLLNKAFVTDVFKEIHKTKVRTSVVHLAAQSDARKCEIDPALAFENNTMVTVNVMDACARNHIQHLIFLSTAYVYGSAYRKNINEDFVLHPEGIYALTKLASETVVRGYAALAGISCDIVRISNVYSPHPKPGTILEEIMTQAKKADKIILRDLTPVRDFIYIDDVVESLLRLVLSPQPGCHVLNLSTGQGVSMGELAGIFCKIQGLDQEILQAPGRQSVGVSRIVLNNEVLYQRLGWKPSIRLKDGLKKIAAYAKT